MGVATFFTLGLAFPMGFFASPILLTVGGVGVAVVGLIEVSNYASSGGRIDQIDDSRGALYDPVTMSAADPDLDFKKLLNVLKTVPPMRYKDGIQCKAPGQILSELENSGGIREALRWQAPSITSGVKISCSNLAGRSFILSGLEKDRNVRLSDDVGATINKFSWKELITYLRRDGSVMSNIEKFQRASESDLSSSTSDSSGVVASLRKYIEDNAPIQSQYDLLTNAVLTGGMIVTLTDLPSNGDIVDESCRFIETKLPK